MAKVEFSPLLEGVRGRVGSLVFRRCGQHTVVQRAPDMTGLQASPAQRAQRDRFQRAVAHSRAVLADPAVRALYAARARAEGKSALVLCVRDHLRTPKVEAMGHVQAWLEQPPVRVLDPDAGHLRRTLGLLQGLGTAGNLVGDAQMADLAMEHNAVLHTAATDFLRFQGLRWFNPLSGTGSARLPRRRA